MNRHRKSFKAIQCPGYSHPLTKQLAGVLRQTQGERFTRFDAFRSLLERQAAENEAHPDTRPCRFEVTHTPEPRRDRGAPGGADYGQRVDLHPRTRRDAPGGRMRRLPDPRLATGGEEPQRAGKRPGNGRSGSGRLHQPLRGSSGDGLARFCRENREAGNSICMSP